MRLKLLYIFLLFQIAPSVSAAQNGFVGNDFWLAFGQNAKPESVGDFHLTVYVFGKVGSTVTIDEVAFKKRSSLRIPNSGYISYEADVRNELIVEGISEATIHITSDSSISVTALSSRSSSTDSYSIIPKKYLGMDYVIIGYDPVNGESLFTTQCEIIATDSVTIVEVTYPDSSEAVEQYQLFKGEVVHLNGLSIHNNDLSGTLIHADKPIAVITGHSCAQIPSNTSYCDMLAEMVPPISVFTNEYFIPPFTNRARSSTRVVALNNNTTVQLDGAIVAKLNTGEWYQTNNLLKAALITANNPICVIHCANSAEDDIQKLSDPFMMLVSPTDKYVHSVEFIIPPLITDSSKETITQWNPELVYDTVTINDTKYLRLKSGDMTIPQQKKKIKKTQSQQKLKAGNMQANRNDYFLVDLDSLTRSRFKTPSASWRHFISIASKTKSSPLIYLDGKTILLSYTMQSGYYYINLPITPGVHTLVSETPIAVYEYGCNERYDSYGNLCGMKMEQ